MSTPTIGFRLEESQRKTLAARAKSVGLSPHNLAKLYVIERLAGGDEKQSKQSLTDAVHATSEQLHTFREDFAYAVQALLMSAGSLDKEVAKRWVEENLTPE
jgi:hypothetical protein